MKKYKAMSSAIWSDTFWD